MSLFRGLAGSGHVLEAVVCGHAVEAAAAVTEMRYQVAETLGVDAW